MHYLRQNTSLAVCRTAVVEELKELLEIKRSVSIHVSERHHLLEFAIAYDNAHGLDASLQLGDIHCSVSVAVEDVEG